MWKVNGALLVCWILAAYFCTGGFAGDQHFLVKPSNTEVMEGSDVELQCQVANKVGALQWSKDGFLLGFDPAIPGYPRYSMNVDEAQGIYNLQIKDVHPEDDGEYQCQVGPAPGQNPIREIARLSVLVSPRAVSIEGYAKESVIRVRPGEKLVLTCSAFRSKPFARLRWFKKNVELLPEASRMTVEKLPKNVFNTHSTIVLYPKADDENVVYSCEALHPTLKQPIRTSATISIMVPPEIPEIQGVDEDETLHVGNPVTLTCISRKGNPQPRLLWYKNGVMIDNSYTYTGNDTINVYSFNVDASDNNAVYKCESYNNVTAKPLSSKVQLSVLYPPSKLFVGAPSEARKGDTIVLMCTTSLSNPAVKLSWAVDGMPVPGGTMTVKAKKEGWVTMSSFEITLTRQDPDVKIFTCYASGPLLQQPLSETVKINIVYPPSPPTIQGYEEGKVLQVGDVLHLTCIVSGGNPPATVHWYKDNVLIQSLSVTRGNQVSNELVITVEQSDNNATYSCQAKSPLLLPQEAVLTLYVVFPPDNVTITVHPFPARLGQMVNAVCVTSPSNPASLITWWKDGTLIADHQEELVVGPHSSKIIRSNVVLNITADDDGKALLCEARNPLWLSSVRGDIWLAVFYKPEFIPEKMDVNIVEGEVWKIHLSLRANPPVKMLKWTKSGDLVPAVSQEVASIESPYRVLADGRILHLVRVSRQDRGIYVCEAENQEGTSRAEVNINVLYPAKVTSVSKTVVVPEGGHAELECHADGNPLLPDDIEWRRANFDFSKTRPLSEEGRSVLTISNVSKEDDGYFECVAFNGLGKESTMKAILEVHFKPTVILSEVKTKVAASLHETLELNCTAEGAPTVAFVWYSGAALIPFRTNDFRLEYVVQNISRTRWQSILLIRNVTRKDYGLYSCVARNDLGFDAVKIELLPKSVPDPPSGLEVVNVTWNSAHVRWSPGFDGGSRQMIRIRHQLVGSDQLLFQDFPPDVSETWLMGLKPESKYAFTASAINEFGESGVAQEALEFFTLSLKQSSSDSKEKSGSRSNSKPRFYRAIGAVVGCLFLLLTACIIFCVCKRRRRRIITGEGRRIREMEKLDPSVEDNVPNKTQDGEVAALYYISGLSKTDRKGCSEECFELQKRRLSSDSANGGHQSIKGCTRRRESLFLFCFLFIFISLAVARNMQSFSKRDNPPRQVVCKFE